MLVSTTNHHHQYLFCGDAASHLIASGGLHASNASPHASYASSSSSYAPSCSVSPPTTTRYFDSYRTPRIVCRTHSSSASTVTSTGGNPSMVAIDSKIEQAMDLVKTHLMFAVREEVEVLRGRIVDLENTVCNLEAENAVLRQHVSDEILRNMNA